MSPGRPPIKKLDFHNFWPNKWDEYYIGLALSALRAMGWGTLHLGGRRLMLLVAALAINELYAEPGTSGSDEATTPDESNELPPP